ncbi:MAG TPA: hypothetical protein DG757_19630 [Bacillus sp. (in: Bacteria)]|nr:hypothetical protein [Bacillus sp. (in: firmicutes)]
MKKHLSLIQFSRVLVPLFVMLLHADAFMVNYFGNGFPYLLNVEKSGGVYYFFALSGFMMYFLYHKDFGNPKLISKFLYSRWIRIYPFYWILTLSVLPFSSLLLGLGTGQNKEMGTIITSLLLFPYEVQPILPPAWSLVHTVLFYLMFTLLFSSYRFFSRGLLFAWGLFSLLFSLNILSSPVFFINFFFNFNSLIFLLGILCGYLIIRVQIPIYLSIVLVFVGILGFPLSWMNTQFGYVNIDLQYTTTVSSVILILGFSSIDLQKDIRLPKLAQFLGDASFSIYLTQFSCMSLISNLFGNTPMRDLPNFLLAAILILSSIICGSLLHVLIEKPIHTKLKSFQARKQLLTANLDSHVKG